MREQLDPILGLGCLGPFLMKSVEYDIIFRDFVSNNQKYLRTFKSRFWKISQILFFIFLFSSFSGYTSFM